MGSPFLFYNTPSLNREGWGGPIASILIFFIF